jgi:hypothetical protein
MDRFVIGGLGCLAIIALILVCGAIGAAVLMVLWNWIMPYLFGLPEIGFWMAWGICILLGFIGNAMRPSVTVSKS